LLIGVLYDATGSNMMAYRLFTFIYLVGACAMACVAVMRSRQLHMEVCACVTSVRGTFAQEQPAFPCDNPSTPMPTRRRLNSFEMLLSLKQRTASFTQRILRRQRVFRATQVAAVE
jgi:hypothetical protein